MTEPCTSELVTYNNNNCEISHIPNLESSTFSSSPAVIKKGIHMAGVGGDEIKVGL